MSFVEKINSGELSADEVINLLLTSDKNRKYLESTKYPTIETVELNSKVAFILSEPNIERNSMTISKIVIKSIDIPSTIGKRIAERRKVLNMTQKELANSVGLEKSTISHYEIDRRLPSIETIIRISYTLDCSLDYLLKGKWDISLVGKALGS